MRYRIDPRCWNENFTREYLERRLTVPLDSLPFCETPLPHVIVSGVATLWDACLGFITVWSGVAPDRDTIIRFTTPRDVYNTYEAAGYPGRVYWEGQPA